MANQHVHTCAEGEVPFSIVLENVHRKTKADECVGIAVIVQIDEERGAGVVEKIETGLR